MFPPSKPNRASRSDGNSTSFSSTSEPNPGANIDTVDTTESASASRDASEASAEYGTYCTKHDITCLPAGASESSFVVGITQSSIGRGDGSPYLAASHACSSQVIVGLTINSGCSGPSPSPDTPGNDGSPDSARFTFADGDRDRNRFMSVTRSSGSSFSPTSDRNVVTG